MASQIPQPLPPDRSRGPLADGLLWTMTGAAIVVVVLRLYARIVVKNSAGWDDLFMSVSLVSFFMQPQRDRKTSEHWPFIFSLGTCQEALLDSINFVDLHAQDFTFGCADQHRPLT